MTDDLLALLRGHIADMHWRDVLLVRDVVTAELNQAINRKQVQGLPDVGLSS